MAKCGERKCPLYGMREVPYAGKLNATIMVIGESPGVQEQQHGTPFYALAPAGKKIRELCKLAGLDWNEFFVANSSRCMIMKDKMLQKDITRVLKLCRTPMERMIRHIKPKAIIVLGDYALNQVIKKKGIKKARGRWHWSDEFNCWVMPTYHPAFICRQSSFGKLAVGDLKLVADFIENDFQPLKNKEKLYYKEVQAIGGLLDLSEKQEFSIGIDTECQGLDWMDPNFLCLSYSISWEKGKGANVVLYEEGTKSESDFNITWPREVEGSKKKEPTTVYVKKAKNFERKLDGLKAILASNKFKKFMMNGNFDVHTFRTLFRKEKGKPPVINRYVMDIQSAAHLIDENIYQLADLSLIQRNFTDFKGDYKGEFDSRFDKSDMLAVMRDHRSDFNFYAIADADVTLRAGLTIKKWMIKNPKVMNYLVKFLMPTLATIVKMEERGALIDAEQLPIVEKEVEALMNEAEQAALAVVPKGILKKHKDKIKKAVDSDKHILTMKGTVVSDILFSNDGFALPILKKTKTGPSMDKSVRQLLLDKPIRKAPREFITQFELFSEYHTLLTRYIRGFEKWIKIDGRIHSKFSTAIAVTGRLSSSKPNMMNNPKRSKSSKKIRKLIRAKPGHKLVSGDASQSELRWLAHVAIEKEMIRIFKNAEMDIHTETAKILVRAGGRKWRELTEDEVKGFRFKAKAVNFGLIFKMSVNGFLRYAKQEYGLDLTQQEGEAWVQAYFNKYKNVRTYHHRIIEECNKNGQVESPLGRIRRLPEIYSQDNMLKAEAERQSTNHPVQSPSSDACLMAANTIENAGYPEDECGLILFIHDDLTYEVREDKVMYYAKKLKHAMENPPLKRDFGIDMKVPLVAEIKVGDNLAEMKELKL